MSLQLSLSGLTSEARALDVVGNNIANSQTVGFKATKARFADVYGAVRTAGDKSSDAVAAGVNSLTLHQQFQQGMINRTDRPLDVAINGKGFFRLQQGNEVTYTRNGEFQLQYEAGANGTPTNNVFLVSRDQRSVTGYNISYAADPQGTAVPSNPPRPIVINTFMPAQATSGVQIGANFDSRSAAPTNPVFNPDDALTFNSNTGVTAYDSTGTPHDLRIYFVRVDQTNAVAIPPANTWNVYTRMDGAVQTGPFPMSFDTLGSPLSGTPVPAQTYALPGGTSVGPLSFDFSGATQFGKSFSYDSVQQLNGYPKGSVESSSGLNFAPNGEIWATYNNGQARRVGQITLSSFTNSDALINVGDGQWMRNLDPVRGNGKEIIDVPHSDNPATGKGMGALTGGATESSNVNLNDELVALIVHQRNYQANAQTFKILDQVLQNLADKVR